jgi:hypothetical protein
MDTFIIRANIKRYSGFQAAVDTPEIIIIIIIIPYMGGFTQE